MSEYASPSETESNTKSTTNRDERTRSSKTDILLSQASERRSYRSGPLADVRPADKIHPVKVRSAIRSALALDRPMERLLPGFYVRSRSSAGR